MTEPYSARAAPRGPWPPLYEWGLLAALLIVFGPALAAMAEQWSRVAYLSHGFALWAFLSDRVRRGQVPIAPSGAGLAPLGLALLLYVAGLAAGAVSLQGLAFVMAAGGATWLLRGAAWLRATAFPLGFLVFMVPPPSSWLTPLIGRLQVFVSTTAVSMLRGVGVEVGRDGNVLVLPRGGALFVAEACSGVTSIVTLLPLGTLVAAYGLRTPLPRLLLLLSVVPLALAGNLARVVVTVLIADQRGVPFATEGLVHELLGLSAYLVACLGMLGIAAGLRRAEAH